MASENCCSNVHKDRQTDKRDKRERAQTETNTHARYLVHDGLVEGLVLVTKEGLENQTKLTFVIKWLPVIRVPGMRHVRAD